jgi:hypothetical protein
MKSLRKNNSKAQYSEDDNTSSDGSNKENDDYN